MNCYLSRSHSYTYEHNKQGIIRCQKGKQIMKYTTHKLTPEQKYMEFENHKDLISMINTCHGYMLRKQMVKLFHLLSGRDEKDIEFDIAELINTGFLFQKKICKDSRTEILYLSKYPRSKFLDVECTGDVPAINWSTKKIFEQIFRIDYLIEKTIPTMSKRHFILEMENLETYLHWKGSNLLLSNNQTGSFTAYRHLVLALDDSGYTLTDELLDDMAIANYDLEAFKANQLKKNINLEPCPEKIRRDAERDSYNSEIEQNKQFYNLKNFAAHGFYIEEIEKKYNIVNIAFFDSMNNIQTKKLYQNLCYILLMFQRYLGTRDVELEVTVYTWDKQRCDHLLEEECKHAYDFYLQEYVDENKKYKIMKDVGLLRQYWDNIRVTYVNEDIFPKYHVHL